MWNLLNMHKLLIVFFALFSSQLIHAVTIEVEGLKQPAEIIVDKFGVPHIYAKDHYDVFFVQGFNAARDRLWQIDLWRRRGLGKLSEVLGKEYLEQDRANRLFLYRGQMYQEWLAYGSDAKEIATKFTDGINAYIDYLETQPFMMPVEFDLLGYKPDKWNPSDVVKIRSHGLWRNASNEVSRAKILCDHGEENLQLWKKLEPDWKLNIPSDFDACSFKGNILEVYNLATAPVRFKKDNASIAKNNNWVDESLGSNNWAISPERSASKSTILANDPHRTHAVPSLRYISHLNGPGINVIGAGEPALPGVSIGHNEDIAFGLTIFAIDQEDLYYYKIEPTNPNAYIYKDNYESITTITETIEIKDSDPVTVNLEFTRHGPIIKREDSRIYALRAAWLEAGMAPYFGSIEYMRANNWREFVSALNRWGAPAENQVYADKEGNIGYKPAGLFPRRVDFDGLLPVSGHGQYEWDGFFDMDVLPVEYNPKRGYVFTANGMNLPEDYPIEKYPLGFEWSAPWRHHRINEVLASQDNHSFSDSIELQRDYQSKLAQKIIEKLNNNIPAEIKSLLGKWDGQMERDSKEAAFFAIWYYRHLNPKLTQELFNDQSLVQSVDSYTMLELIDDKKYQNIVNETLMSALEEAKKIMGENQLLWKWEDLHQIKFIHPLYDQLNNPYKDIMFIKNYGRGGTGNTPNSTSFSPIDFRVRSGGSWRFVVDTNDWDGARMTNAPGQSGDPRSKYYDNLLYGWANDASFPLYFSKEAILKNKDFIIELVPKNN